MYFSWSNFFVGIIGIAVGVYLIKDSFNLNHHVLFLGWVEKKYGPGSGTLAYKLIGLGVIIFSTFVAIGQVNLVESAFGGGSTTTSQTNANQTVIQTPTGRSGIAP
jgi:hypothetical protein